MRERSSLIYFLGIDVGTTGTRALILSHRGNIVASATEEHEAFSSPQIGWAEQNPEDWWRACIASTRKALAMANMTGEDISCVGFSGQMHGAVMLDERARVVRPALIWCDTRSAKQSRDFTNKVGAVRIIQLTCNPALTNFTLTKFLWVREVEPENWKRVRSVMLPKDYVRFCLTGERAIDMADASGTLLLDVANRRWSSEILEAAEIDQQLLPILYESTEVCGQISVAGGAATGLRAGTPVVAGAGDQAAGAVGMGITVPGAVSATIGSSGVVFAVTDHPLMDMKGRLHTFCHAIPGCWHVMGVTQSAGLSLRWFRDHFGTQKKNGSDGYEELIQEATTVQTGSDGLLWTPYLMGERTPHLDPNARAALIGLTLVHGRGHVIRAILEGVAFSLKDTFMLLSEMGVPINRIRLGGGGARSSLWRQIQADVYGQEVEILEAEEGAALGAAILAGVGVKAWPSVHVASKGVVRISERVQPNRASVAVLNDSYAAYKRVYDATKSIFETGLDSQLSDTRQPQETPQ
jgi:xylulokinase